MDVLLKSLTQDASTYIIILALLGVVLVLSTVGLYLKVKRFETRWKALLRGARGDSLEELLHDHLLGREEINEHLGVVDGRLSTLESQMKSSKRYIGLVRFDAFPDVAGNQSFAMAVYDDGGDGAILSSIVGRSTCRVYCKPLVAGRSERDLSQEEQRALRAAKEPGLRTILSP